MLLLFPLIAEASGVGIADFTYLVNQHPDTPTANIQLQKEREALRQEFDEKTKTSNPDEKKKLDQELMQKLEKTRLALLKGVADKVVSVVTEIQKEKKLDIVFDKRDWICGGVDITQDVLDKMNQSQGQGQ